MSTLSVSFRAVSAEAPGERGGRHLWGGPVVGLCAAGPLGGGGEAAFGPRYRRPPASPAAIAGPRWS